MNDAAELRFAADHKWHSTMIALYLTIIEYCKAAHVLALAKSSIALSSTLRSVLEAYADLSNLARDQDYGYFIEAAHDQEWIKVLRRADGTNMYLSMIAEAPDLANQLKQYKSHAAELKSKGYEPLSQHKKFKCAGLADEYTALYNFLCCSTHNNLRALRARHMHVGETKDKPELTLFGTFEKGFTISALDYIIALLFEASRVIYTALESSFTATLPCLHCQLDDIRRKYEVES